MVSVTKEFLQNPIFFQYGRINVLMVILLAPEEGGVVEMSVSRLASMTGLTEVTVRCALSDLEFAGAIMVLSPEKIAINVLPYGLSSSSEPVARKPVASKTTKPKKAKSKEEEPVRRFVPPTTEQVAAYVSEKGYSFDPAYFVSCNESKGWMRGKTKIKDWKALCRTWQMTINKSNTNKNHYEQSRQERRELLARAEAQTTQLSDSALAALLECR